MFLDGGYILAFYAVALVLFCWLFTFVLECAPDPGRLEVIVYRVGPVVLWIIGVIARLFFP